MKKDQVEENQEVVDNTANGCGCNENCGNVWEAANMAEEATASGDTEQLLADQAAEWKDKYMRLSAEFDNFRKRTLKEKMELMEYGGESVIKSFLKIVDDYDRAVDAMAKSNDVDSIKQGISLIHSKLSEVLTQNGVTEIEAMGSELDTDFHDAIAKVPSGEENKGRVIDVVEKGYKLKEKVIRYAKVVVGE